MYYMTVIHPSGERQHEKRASAFPLDEIQEAVGGYIETVPHFDTFGNTECVAFCNDTGKLDGLDLNTPATYLWYACLSPKPFTPQSLCGSVCIITADTPEEMESI